MLDDAGAPLSVDDVYRRTRTGRSPISLATIRRTLNQLTAAGLLRRLYSESNKPHYEKIHRAQRESLIDSVTGQRLEFHSEGIEGLLKHAVHQLGYRLLDYRLELFGVPNQGAPRQESNSADSTAAPTVVAPTSRSRRRPRH
jgi:Fur family ferric uptake transcriptional regulator